MIDIHRWPRQPGKPGDFVDVKIEISNLAAFSISLAGILVFRAVIEWQRSLLDIAFIAKGIPFYFCWRRRLKAGRDRSPLREMRQ